MPAGRFSCFTGPDPHFSSYISLRPRDNPAGCVRGERRSITAHRCRDHLANLTQLNRGILSRSRQAIKGKCQNQPRVLRPCSFPPSLSKPTVRGHLTPLPPSPTTDPMGGLTYDSTGVDYGTLDAFKRACQRHAAATAGALARARPVRARRRSRAKARYLIETPDEFLAHVEEGLGTKNLVADAVLKLTGEELLRERRHRHRRDDRQRPGDLGALPVSVAMHAAVGDSSWFADAARAEDLARRLRGRLPKRRRRLGRRGNAGPQGRRRAVHHRPGGLRRRPRPAQVQPHRRRRHATATRSSCWPAAASTPTA